MSPFTRIRLALYATYVALRAVGYVLMFKLGFVPQHMHAEMVAKFVAAEARPRSRPSGISGTAGARWPRCAASCSSGTISTPRSSPTWK